MILDILASAGFGSALGGLFGYLGKREERANLRMKLEHDINMVKARTSAALEVGKLSLEESQVQGSLAVQKVEAEAFKESQKTASPVSDILKSVIRPAILAVLFYQTYTIINTLETLTKGLESMPAEDVLLLYKIVILAITGLTATATGWYFSARSSKQFDKLLDKWN